MGTWSRSEIEEAFERYQQAAAEAARTHDWTGWANCFTEDATYIEHLYGEMHGRDVIYNWISKTMSKPPGREMDGFPIEWYVIDEDRGWVVCQIWNRMGDPGDGSVHQEYNFSLLKYAGDGLWSYEEDIYNPARFVSMIEGWTQVRDAAGSA